jgi:hypothetical protein
MLEIGYALAMAAAALFFGLMFIRRRRRPGRDG